jgi:hypothetical protein
MPKDYRERRIDEKPPRFRAKQAKRSTTTDTDPTGDSGSSSSQDLFPAGGEAVATVAPGDGVLWFLRQDTAAAAPSGRNVTLKTRSDGAVTFSYVASPGGWSNYITSFVGDTVYGTDGITVLVDETVYVIWDQFSGFTGGDYKFVFTPATGTIDRAILLRNVSTTSPGTFYSGMAQTPTWTVTYSGMEPEDKVDNLPRTFSLGAAGTARAAYAIYQMSGLVEAPAAIYRVPGMTLLNYTLQDPSDQPYFRRSVVSFYGSTLKTTTTLEVVAPFEAGWGGAF